MLEVNCPHCRTPVKWHAESRWKPFCSERCRLIDLGEWMDENYRLQNNGDQSASTYPDDDSAGNQA